MGVPLVGAMAWLGLIGKGIFSGAIIVAASELAKSKSLFGALLISLPLTSIMAIIWLWRDSGDVDKVAEFSQSILWLVLPSLALFAVLPWLLGHGWEFVPALSVGILCTILAYGIGIWAAGAIPTSA